MEDDSDCEIIEQPEGGSSSAYTTPNKLVQDAALPYVPVKGKKEIEHSAAVRAGQKKRKIIMNPANGISQYFFVGVKGPSKKPKTTPKCQKMCVWEAPFGQWDVYKDYFLHQWQQKRMQMSFYDILGITPEAGGDEIQAARISLLYLMHPGL